MSSGSGQVIEVHFPPCLAPNQRARLHEIAELFEFSHESRGENDKRHIVLSKHSALAQVITVPDEKSMKDVQIAAILLQHFGIPQQKFMDLSINKTPTKNKQEVQKNSSNSKSDINKYSIDCDVQYGNIQEFAQKMSVLIDLEHEAEVEQATKAVAQASEETVKASGNILSSLTCIEIEGGLLQRSLITLVSNKGGGEAGSQPLPPHKFSPHDVIAVRPQKGDGQQPPLANGIVYRVRENSIVIAAEEYADEIQECALRLEKLANEITYQRYKFVIKNLLKSSELNLAGSNVLQIGFGSMQPRVNCESQLKWKPFNRFLDDSQKEAITFALQSADLALVHGPPGTGKTTTVAEYMLQEVKRGNRVLCCTASNIAVDNVVERLVKQQPKLKIVRVGHPARLLPQVVDASLDARVMKSDDSQLAKDCRKEIKSINQQMMKLKNYQRAERKQLRAQVKHLQKEESRRQQKAVDQVLSNAQVICTTLVGAASFTLKGAVFDVVIIDEAAQATEVSCWCALTKAPKAILAGDHKQLPPTVVHPGAEKKGLGVTLFQRLHSKFGEEISRMLRVQYRMNKDIMEWSSEQMYGGQLVAHESVAEHAVDGLSVLVFVDTAGCDMEEAVDEETESKYNTGEAEVVWKWVRHLHTSGLQVNDIGVISPYNAQVARLRQMREDAFKQLEISSVDGFQGREKEAIIISMVRCNSSGEVGFLADQRRMNVAITRARKHCCVIGDSETMARDNFLNGICSHFENRGEYLSALEVMDME